MLNSLTQSKLIIQPWKSASAGAKTLQKEIRLLTNSYPETSRVSVYKYTLIDIHPNGSASTIPGSLHKNVSFINWGNSKLVDTIHENNREFFTANNARILNENSGLYSDKIKFFRFFGFDPMVPWFTTNREVALDWLVQNPSKKLCVRFKTSASGGDGLTIFSCNSGEILPEAPLYVEYKPKKHEFRYHFFKGMDGFLQQKRLRSGTTEKNFEIRNHTNNWVFCREAVDNIPAVRDFCEKLKLIAVENWGLDFGAFDIIYNQSENKCYVLEINTAPGLEGQTGKDYAKFFLEDHLRNTRGVAF
jgi:hypothetical protein